MAHAYTQGILHYDYIMIITEYVMIITVAFIQQYILM